MKVREIRLIEVTKENHEKYNDGFGGTIEYFGSVKEYYDADGNLLFAINSETKKAVLNALGINV